MTPAGQNTHPTPRYRSVNQLIPCVTCVTESSREEKHTNEQRTAAGPCRLRSALHGNRPTATLRHQQHQPGQTLSCSRPPAPSNNHPTNRSVGRPNPIRLHPNRGVKVTRTRPLRSEPGRAALSSARRCVQIPIAAPAERLPPPSEQAVRV